MASARTRRGTTSASAFYLARRVRGPDAGSIRGVPCGDVRRAEVKYEYLKTDRAGTVRITTANAEALKALHEFLRFQDHRTGDSMEVK